MFTSSRIFRAMGLFMALFLCSGVILASGGDRSGRCVSMNLSSNCWTWINGSNTLKPMAVYGTKGVFDNGNTPGGRYNAMTWKDGSGNIWLFGGQSDDTSAGEFFFGDLWKYDVSTGYWAWMHGNNSMNQYGIYGDAFRRGHMDG
jgi:hypothetical protein